MHLTNFHLISAIPDEATGQRIAFLMSKGEIQHVVYPVTLYGMIHQRCLPFPYFRIHSYTTDNFHLTIKAYLFSILLWRPLTAIYFYFYLYSSAKGGNGCNVRDSIFRKYFNIMKCKIKPSTNLKMKGTSSVELLLLPESLVPNFKCINNSETISVGSGGGTLGPNFL